MATTTHGLGGRLPLLGPESLTDEQRDLYDRMISNIVPLTRATGFKSTDDDGHLIGPFNAALFSPEMGESFLALQKVEAEHTSLSKRVRQVVILTVGSIWKAPYEIYAHSAAASLVGLSPEQIEDLASGRIPAGLSEGELAAQQFTRQLVLDRAVDDAAYADAHAAFGDRGLVEMTVLIGCYLSVCASLNAFAVPVPADDS